MHFSTRLTAAALAGAFALSVLAAPASANVVPDSSTASGGVNVSDNLKLPVCVPNPNANVLGVAVPIGSAQSATCSATAH
ncbi:hypothetical protein SAMN05444920_119219 [Nonomuraea solani]|uniref:Small secreted domain n=1 Tax=Nonomuraea solani TaxID=1144553 RepID=A0A1H6EWN4_9ACTN|nr:hypothetical protein SAMN05444920_119219 [Nonomuraea solani]